jgi:mxaJ protein
MHGQLKLPVSGRRVIAVLAMGALVSCHAAAWGQSAGLGAAGELVDPDNLRVCADPSNMPLSDEGGQGFENKLADLLAQKLGRKSTTYAWYPQVQGFVRNTLRANRCDIIMGYPQGDEQVQNTNAYYRSAYVMIYKKNNGLDGVEMIADEKLQGKKIGIVEGTPPSANMAAAHLLGNAKVYPLMFDTRKLPSQAEVMVKDLVSGTIDVAVLWGPTAGYYVKTAKADLAIVPLLKEKAGVRMTYRITMGVRPSDQTWKRALNDFIKSNQTDINKILIGYGVPLLDEQDRPITQ